MRTLVTGGTGTLGGACLDVAQAAGHDVVGTYRRAPGEAAAVQWQALDIRGRDQVQDVIGHAAPDLIIHTAFDPGDWATTATGAVNVALAAADAGANLVTISSDAVFSGEANPYREDARPSPVTPYGAAKAAAEEAVAAVLPDAAVVRTSLVIGDQGVTRREQRVHELVVHPDRGVLFTDDGRCPVHVGDLAAAILEIASSGRRGIHHVAGSDCLSNYDLAVLIAERDGLDPQRLRTGLRSESGVGGAVVVRLDGTQTQSALTTRVRGAREFLRRDGPAS